MADRDIKEFLETARARVGGAAVVSLADLHLRRGVIEPAPEPQFCLAQLKGRLAEVSAQGASAVLTAALGLVLEAQHDAEPVAWITLASNSFYPPDFADGGVDLDALVVVRVPEVVAATRASERLLRCGAFGLVVVDVGADVQVPTGHQGRLVSLAQQHDAAIVFLTEKPERLGSLGSLVSLRAEAVRERIDGSYGYRVRAIKDKRRGPGWEQRWQAVPPAGLK